MEPNSARELLVIETTEVTVILKGKLNTEKHVSGSGDIAMSFSTDVDGAQIYDCETEKLIAFRPDELKPIFFENGQYELLILPKDNEEYSFHHEYEGFRNAVGKLSRSNISTGTLHFRNEVGLSTMEIHKNGNYLFSFTIEVFPTKLDYQKDYRALLDEINAEIYNLAFSFIKRTHLRASKKQYKDPSLAEFFRILQEHFEEYLQALVNVERFPNHKLVTHYEEVRGDRLRKQDSRGRAHLRKNAHRFVEVKSGVMVNGRTVMPEKGLLTRKQQTHDTHENRYVKWTMLRISARIGHLRKRIILSCEHRKVEPDAFLIQMLTEMEHKIAMRLKKPLWCSVGKLDRSVYSLVLQMGTGYREVFQIYALLSQSLVLHGDVYKMSVKDIATLYEYWTFLKLGQILAKKTKSIEQTVVHVNKSGLFVNLKQGQSAIRKFEHPETGEKIELHYQFNTGSSLPTGQQKPDSMLSLTKRGKDYDYRYIFDAKYRVDVLTTPGPQQDDINTMHRYRDSIVAEQHNGYYERTAFGAYVLFPWNNEQEYRNHPYFRSIETVNIGGLPFLPNHTALVEEILDNLLMRTAGELQEQGILPIGSPRYVYAEQKELLIDGAKPIAADERNRY